MRIASVDIRSAPADSVPAHSLQPSFPSGRNSQIWRTKARSRSFGRKPSRLLVMSLGDILAGLAAFPDLVPPSEVDLTTLKMTFENALAVTPDSIRPFLSLLVNDATSVVQLRPTPDQLGRLALLYYLLFATPGPLAGILDFYILNPLGQLLQKRWRTGDFAIRDRLGGGNYGTTYEAILSKPDEQFGPELTRDQKNRRVVLKRVNLDSAEIRGDFLGGGTMARGAGETGQAEAYMYAKIGRNLVVRPWCAEYKGVFFSEQSVGGFVAGSQWLVWNFESDATLADAVEGPLGAFPDCIQEYILRNGSRMEQEERDIKVIKRIMKRIFTGIKNLHGMGIVHRDIKPANLLITVSGDIKMIDFGAAVDLSSGVNFNPAVGMLDPRYSPPEELIFPKNFPLVQPPILAALIAPLMWWIGRPDLFDTYSAGMILVQMSIPELRSMRTQRLFVQELKDYFDDLKTWRAESARAQTLDFSLLDRNNGAGWDLACKLVRRRNDFLRGRLSAAEALRHRYFRGFY